MASGFLKGTLILTIAGFVVKAIGSINWILLSRILGGEGIGIYQMAFPIYLLLLQISSAGVPIAISIFAKRVFNISFTMLTITGFIASLAMYFGADWLISSGLIAESRAYYSIIALAPAVFFVTWISCFRGYIQGAYCGQPNRRTTVTCYRHARCRSYLVTLWFTSCCRWC